MVSRLKRNEAMANERTPMRAPWGDIAPRLTEISDTVLFDDVWRRPGLSPRDRSLILPSQASSLSIGATSFRSILGRRSRTA